MYLSSKFFTNQKAIKGFKMKYFLLGMLFVSSMFGITREEADIAVQSAHKFFGEKLWEEALSEYQTALDYRPSAQIFYNIGQCYCALNKPGFALAYFLKAESIKPRWELLQQTLKKFYTENTQFVPVEKHFHEKIFSFFSFSTWKAACSLAFWGCIIAFVYFLCIQNNKYILYAGYLLSCTFCFLFVLILSQNRSKQNGILPEITVARFAPSEQSPVRYNWDAGTQCKIKTERDNYFFVNTTFGEDGWIKKQDFISL